MNTEAIRNLSFLVIEDDPFQREVLATLLGTIGAQHIMQAENGREALEKWAAAETPVDIVICDLNMPEMDGMAVLRRLSQMNSKVSIILVSSHGRAILESVQTMADAYRLHVLGIMPKPCSRSQLLALVAKREISATTDVAHDDDAIPRQEIVTALNQAEFVPYFQPKVDMSSGEVVGMEALARWRSPNRGVVAPGDFIAAIEDYGLMDTLTWIILNKSAMICRAWREQDLALTVSVNLSQTSLSRLGLAERIHAVVANQGILPSDIVLEITESAAMTDIGSSLENLSRLRLRGFGLSIDDFGTGYSSAQQLTRIPFSELKIDRSFVQHSDQESTRVILESTLSVAHSLGIKVTAEGVETLENWEMLRELGCDIAQGYLIAKPMPEEAVKDWLASWTLPTHLTVRPTQKVVDILLVEKENPALVRNAENHGESIENLGIGRVARVQGLKEALRRLAETYYDLVITDIDLGEDSGLDLIRLIRTQQTLLSPATRLILLFDHDEWNVLMQSIVLDINGFLRKPVNLRTLKNIIQQALAEDFSPQPPQYYLESESRLLQPPAAATPSRASSEPISHRLLVKGQLIALPDLRHGMVLAEPIYSLDKRMMILAAGHTLTFSIINRLWDIRDYLACTDVRVFP